MPRKAKGLSALEIKRLHAPGFYLVGAVPGLGLQVRDFDSRSWVLRYSAPDGRRRETGLGPYPEVSLARAREVALAARESLRDGIDPIDRRREARVTAGRSEMKKTFGDHAEAYIVGMRAVWKADGKSEGQWRATLRDYAEKIMPIPVGDITTEHVVEALQPIWAKRTETAKRLQNRLEVILAYADKLEGRQRANPAAWRGNLSLLLPAPRRFQRVQHHAALPWSQMPGFMKRLHDVQGQGARALEFTILTAARSGETRGLTWGEVDLDAALWVIRAARAKGKREHRIPLSAVAVEVLRAQLRGANDAFVFPGVNGKALSDMTLSAVFRRMGVDATPHGMRSSFRDWCAEATDCPREVAEAALAHVTASATELAYRRSDFLERRRVLMAEWAGYLHKPEADVRPITDRRKKPPA
jgi:integrase